MKQKWQPRGEQKKKVNVMAPVSVIRQLRKEAAAQGVTFSRRLVEVLQRHCEAQNNG